MFSWRHAFAALVVAPCILTAQTEPSTQPDKPALSGTTQAVRQNPVLEQNTDQKADKIVLSGPATTARIADPNEPVVINGRVMRMADFVAAVAASNAAVQRLRNQEMRNREKDSPTQPSQPKN